MDVMAKSRAVGHVVNGTYTVTDDAGFAPETFSYAARFNLRIDGALSAPSLSESNVIKSGVFFGGVSTPSPFTASLVATAPESLVNQMNSGSASYLLAVPKTATVVAPAAVSQRVFLSVGQFWSSAAGYEQYGRSVSWTTQGAPIAASSLTPWSPDEFVAHWQSLVGQTLDGAYKESYDLSSQSPYALLGGVTPPPPTLHDNVSIYGDVVIRSVTVVPEPSTYLLMGLGLSLVAVVRRRQQAA
ncbi:PEP-CTERM sorting domain-containing protein [Ideonella sp.]|uniref:PEP-CTERM sorting domain-containing protein n=1 Tax=Ideonella sp. TaxID=1929293 RepID=UPI003BB78D35